MSFTLAASQKKDILIVDDTPENLAVLLRALTEEGYSVRCARSGNLAIASAQAVSPDLVLLDILMPKMDGYEVCQRLRQDIRTSDVPIIFLSALADGRDKSKAFAMGASDYIAKPFDLEEVLARVKHQLNLQQRRTQLQRRAARYRQMSYELRAAYTLRLDVLNSLAEGVAVFHPIVNDEGDVTDFQATTANTAFLQLLGHDATMVDLATETLKTLTANQIGCELPNLCWQVFQSNMSLKREWQCAHAQKPQWIEAFCTKLHDGIMVSLRDINDTKSQIATLETTTQELYTLATTDVLTQVGNRYHFESYFTTEWQRSVRERQPLSLLMSDIDQFKRQELRS